MSDKQDEIGTLVAHTTIEGRGETASTASHVQEDGPLPLPRRLLAVFSLSAGTILLTMDASIAPVALPTIVHDLNVSASTSTLVVVVYNLVLAMTLLSFASLGERLGLRRVFLLGLVCYILGAGMCLVGNDLGALLVARALQASGTAAALSVSIALVRHIYPPAQLGRGLGINTIAGVTGAALGPAVGGLILSIASWHWVFAAAAPLAIASLAAGRALPEPERHGKAFDRRGAALCAATFGLLITGLESLTDAHLPLASALLLLAGVAVAVIFVRHEAKTAHPVLPVDLLVHPTLALSVAATFSAVLGSTILIWSAPFRLHALGFSAAQIGGTIVPYAVAIGIFAPTSGMLSDRVNPALIGTIGLMIAIVGSLCVALPLHPNAYDVAWRMALVGTGFGLFFSPNARLIVAAAPRGRVASASSLIATTRMFGQALSSTLLGGLLALGLGQNGASAVLAALLATVAFACSAARLRLPRGWLQGKIGRPHP